MLNLDYYCMKYGQLIGDIGNNNKCENDLRKALGILKEDGIYAMFLWLQHNNADIRKGLVDFLSEDNIKTLFLDNGKCFSKDFKKFCNELREVAKDIDKLLLMKKLLERTLVYALYHAMVGGEKNVAQV